LRLQDLALLTVIPFLALLSIWRCRTAALLAGLVTTVLMLLAGAALLLTRIALVLLARFLRCASGALLATALATLNLLRGLVLLTLIAHRLNLHFCSKFETAGDSRRHSGAARCTGQPRFLPPVHPWSGDGHFFMPTGL
jgi:hypothetical protein